MIKKWVQSKWIFPMAKSLQECQAGSSGVSMRKKGFLRMKLTLLFSRPVVSSSLWTLWTAVHQASLSFPSSQSCPSSCSLQWWCHPAISSFDALSSSALGSSQNQGIFQWVICLHQMAKILELQLQHHSCLWVFRVISLKIDWFDLLAVQGTLWSLPQQHSLKASFL